jgi:hypothetical protein
MKLWPEIPGLYFHEAKLDIVKNVHGIPSRILKYELKNLKTKLRGRSTQANYTDRATAAFWQS